MAEFAAATSPHAVAALPADKLAKANEVVAKLQQEGLTATIGDAVGFLKYRDWDVNKAVVQYKSKCGWDKTFPTVTIADVAPFLMTPEGSQGPDGAVFVLEDGKGGCARDKQGRPIVVSIGMTHGTALEMQKQFVYSMNRARQYYTEGTVPSHFVAIEVVPKKGATATFRFPDESTKTVMEIQRQYFPATLSSTTYFSGGKSSFLVMPLTRFTYRHDVLPPPQSPRSSRGGSSCASPSWTRSRTKTWSSVRTART